MHLLDVIPASVGRHSPSDVEDARLHVPEGAFGVLRLLFPGEDNEEIWLGKESFERLYLPIATPGSLVLFLPKDNEVRSPGDDMYPDDTAAVPREPQARPNFSIARLPRSIAAGAMLPEMLTVVCRKLGGEALGFAFV